VPEARMNLDNKIKGCEEKVKTLEVWLKYKWQLVLFLS
jgi:hypothetical protein